MFYFLLIAAIILLALGFSHAVLTAHIRNLKTELATEIAKLKGKVR